MIEFIEEHHIYLLEGVITPSVSQILKATLFKDMYKGVPKANLQKASEFGINVHDAIEREDPSKLKAIENLSYEQWVKIRDKHGIKPLEQEIMIHYYQFFCGTLDMVAELDGELVIMDIKTTSKVYEEYLSWQLTLYKYAYEFVHGKELKKAYCIWLPKKKAGKLLEIPFKSHIEVMELLESYLKEVEG